MRRRKSYDDIPIDFDIFEDMIEDLIDHIEEVNDGNPVVYGFSITKRPGEEPEVFEFGSRPRVDDPVSAGYKPLLEVFETDDSVYMVAELPGIDKEDISLDATENTLTMRVRVDDQIFSENVELPARVDPSSAVAGYRNGVLEVTLTRIGDAKTRIEIR
ncbi:Hsp20/alpha crystallin family protein [Methanosarcinales archaeon]|nr:MAG: Hsp20/alpha crystallin family protein [Methanosarcinales archaeon]